MALVVISRSGSFIEHVQRAITERIDVRTELAIPVRQRRQIVIIQDSSFGSLLVDWLDSLPSTDKVIVAIATDHPNVEEMLEYSHRGAQAYFNSYMAIDHYRQMIRLLKSGQSWYPPLLLEQAFGMARRSVVQKQQGDPLGPLTQREKEIARAVADGMSNKMVARMFGITERTVKAHLTRIFKKLALKDRVALVLFLQKFHLDRS